MLHPGYLERGSALIAALCLTVGGWSLASPGSVVDAAPTAGLVAAITPQEAQQWVTVLADAVNKLMAAVNVAIGLWQSVLVVTGQLAKAKAKAKQDTSPGGPSPGPGVGPGPPGRNGKPGGG